MLFAKDFKTALAVVIASVGLLSGTASASVLLADGDYPQGGDEDNVVAVFAAEAVSADAMDVTATATTADAQLQEVDLALLNDDRYFIRIDLTGGLQFGAGFGHHPIISYTDATDGAQTETAFLVRDGAPGDASGIWSLSVDTDDGDAEDTDGVTQHQVQAGMWNILLPGLRAAGLKLPAGAAAGDSYNIRLRLFDNIAEARRAMPEEATGAGDRDSALDASAMIVKVVDTLDASVGQAQTLTASVASNFRRFLVETGGATHVSLNTLSTASVTVTDMDGDFPIMNPADGDLIAPEDVLDMVTFTLTGDFSHSMPFEFGEFALGGTPMKRYGEDGMQIDAAVAAMAKGKAETVDVRVEVSTVGTFPITVNVGSNNVGSPTNPYSQIGRGMYQLSWTIEAEGNAPDKTGMGAAGTIVRDGTTVRLAYLSTAAGATRYYRTDDEGQPVDTSLQVDQTWNQRLLVTNHSSINADVTLSDFAAGDGVSVMCKAYEGMEMPPPWTCGTNGEVMATVAPDAQMVLRVQDVLMITGANRTAGYLTVAADEGSVSVATTHVTLPLGTTDTVIYWPLDE